MEVLFQLLFEVLGQALFEIAMDVLARSNKPVERVIASSFLLGLLAILVGLTSLALLPHHVFHNGGIQLAALIFIPVLNGLLMSAIGRHMRSKGRDRSPLEHFVPAFTFSLVVSLIRFLCAK